MSYLVCGYILGERDCSGEFSSIEDPFGGVGSDKKVSSRSENMGDVRLWGLDSKLCFLKLCGDLRHKDGG